MCLLTSNHIKIFARVTYDRMYYSLKIFSPKTSLEAATFSTEDFCSCRPRHSWERQRSQMTWVLQKFFTCLPSLTRVACRLMCGSSTLWLPSFLAFGPQSTPGCVPLPPWHLFVLFLGVRRSEGRCRHVVWSRATDIWRRSPENESTQLQDKKLGKRKCPEWTGRREMPPCPDRLFYKMNWNKALT